MNKMDDLISRQAAIDAFNTNIDELVVAGKENADAVERYLNRVIDEIKQLPSVQPEIIRCEKCQFSEYDALYGDRYCHYDGKAEIVPDEHFCGYGRERQNG